MMEKLSTDYAMITENLKHIREKLPASVKLLAASKTVPVEVINYAVDKLGITDIGENRVQELLDKYDSLHKDKLNIHFIGSLQTNKVKYIIDKVCLIHSLDSMRLAEEINRQAKKIDKIMDVLVEVNSGEENNKSGIMPADTVSFISELKQFNNINVKGLMTMAPVWDINSSLTKEEHYKIYFQKVNKIFIDISHTELQNEDTPLLSMGMSDSYEVAVECGANVVRLGTAIFGRRT